MTENVFAVYKPKGPTSNDVVQEIKKGSGVRKIGHGGTLDPLARGVLVIGVDEGTRLLTADELKEKEYLADIKLGEYSSTDDEEGEKAPIEIANKPEIKEINATLKMFIGKISQTPPPYSAVKFQGKEAYKLARKGKEVRLSPRPAEIKEIEVLDYSWPILKLRVVTGPGVYIRSLARDIGEKLGTGGYVADLERTRVGRFEAKDTLSIEGAIDKLKGELKNRYTVSDMITIDEFKKAEIKIGRVLVAEKVPETDKLLRLVFDFGSEERQIISGIATSFPDPSVLVGKELPVLVNLEPRELKGLVSDGMLIATGSNEKAILLVPESEVPPGSIVR